MGYGLDLNGFSVVSIRSLGSVLLTHAPSSGAWVFSFPGVCDGI